MSDRPDLMSVTELPEAMLRQLVAGGEIMSVTTFDEHMRPDVHWIAPEEYRIAFDELIAGEDTVTDCAAYTKPGSQYPGYVNIARDSDGNFIFTARADPKPALTAAEGAKDPPMACGETIVVTIPEDEFHQLFASANRLRVPSEDQHDLGLDADADAGGATADDPLAQRADPPEEGGPAPEPLPEPTVL